MAYFGMDRNFGGSMRMFMALSLKVCSKNISKSSTSEKGEINLARFSLNSAIRLVFHSGSALYILRRVPVPSKHRDLVYSRQYAKLFERSFVPDNSVQSIRISQHGSPIAFVNTLSRSPRRAAAKRPRPFSPVTRRLCVSLLAIGFCCL